MKTKLLIFFTLLITSPQFAQTPHPIVRYLNADMVNDQVRLSWVITGGNTCSGIIIQRSLDGLFFESIGEIDGICGSPDVDVPYVFLDPEPIPNQNNYYRLELGTQGYSTPVVIEFVPLNNKGYSVKYDILSRIATVYFKNDSNENASYRLFSTSGKLIYENNTSNSKITIDLSPTAAQIYLLTITINNNTIGLKVPGF